MPKEYALKFDPKNPSTYDQYVAFTGPYMVKNDSSGKVVGRVPGKQIQIVRNPNWDAKHGLPPAYLDAVNIEEGNDDLTVASRRTLQRQRDALLRRRLAAGAGAQAGAVSATRTRSSSSRPAARATSRMNTTIKPFDNLNVRKARHRRLRTATRCA